MTTLALTLLAATLGHASAAGSSRLGLVAFRRIPIPDDIPAHLCTALAQDRDGFLWIGTQGGLVRYDGYEFRVFKPVPDDPRTLGGSYVRVLLAARDGRVWVGTFSNGVSVYDPATETFVRYPHDAKSAASLSHDRVEALAEDRQGAIWVATNAGLDRIDPATARVERVPLEGAGEVDLGGDRLRALLVDRVGRLWVGGHGGLLRLDEGRRRFQPVPLPGNAHLSVSRLYEDERGRVWIGTLDDGAAVLETDGRLHRLRPQPARGDGLSHFWVYGIAPGAPGEVWLATFGGGVDVVDADSLRVVDRLRHDPGVETTVGSDRVGGLLRDRSGLVWVGTWGQGLARHDPAARAFRALRHSASRPQGLSHPAAVRALEMKDGTLWVGTNGNGVDILDWQRGRIGGHRPDPRDRAALADGAVTCLAQSGDGTAWVATLSGVLHRQRPGARGFERFTQASGLPGGPIRALTFGPGGELWVGSAAGLARIEPATGRVTSWRHDPADSGTLSGHAVEAIAFGADGTLWVGTDSGLNAFDPRRGTAVRILHEPGRADGLPNNWVPDLMRAADGRLWVATQSGACLLTAWDGRTARFESVAARLGRRPEPTESLIQDTQGFVWVGPRLRVDPRTWQAQEITPADGLDFRSFFIASRSLTSDGGLLFGSPEGLIVVRPEQTRPWQYAPPVLPVSLWVEGQERAGAPRLERLVLSPPERAFRLGFAALDFTAPLRTTYRYRLEGFDPGWVAADASHRSLTYTNLAPAHYLLRVQGTNRAGRFSAHEIRLPILVLPAFHQTRSFRVLATLAALGLVYGMHRLRIRRLQARGRELEQVVAERTQELRQAYARIEEASLTDPLTGLHNRRFLERSIEGDVELAARRHEGGNAEPRESDLVFLLIDLDHFKRVNDGYGHGAGDAVLRQAALTLREVLRSSDHLVRWGGEEFLAVARFIDREGAAPLAEKIRAAMAARTFHLDDEATTLSLTCSVGFAAYPFSQRHPRAVSWMRVVEAADLALYAAKRSGRNRWSGLDASQADEPERSLREFQDHPEAGGVPGIHAITPPEGSP